MLISPLRLLVWFLAFVVIATPVAAVILFLLAITGSPGSCRSDDRPIAVSPELAAALQAKLDQLDASLDAGQVSTIVFDESEATSRARQWADEHEVPVSDVYVCFDVDRGSASGKVDAPFLPGDVDVLIRGRLDLTGVRPELKIDEIKAGGLPGPLTGLMKGFINDLVDNETEDIVLEHDYGLAFGDGEATINGQP